MVRKITLFILWFSINLAYAQDFNSTIRLAGKTASVDTANSYLKTVKKLIKSNSDRGIFYYVKGTVELKNGEMDSALFFSKKALTLLKNTNEYESIIGSYNTIGEYYNNKGQYDKAIDQRFNSLKIAELHQLEELKGGIYINLAYDFHDFESYEKGAFYGKKAIQYFLNKKDSKPKDIRSSFNATAINYDDWNKPQLALFYHKQNLKYIKGKDTLLLHSTFNNIGNTLLKQKKYAEAKKWVLRAVKIIDYKVKINDLQHTDYNYATCYTNLGTICTELNQIEEAKKYFELAFFYAKKSATAEKIRDYYFQKALFNKKTNNLEETIIEQENYIKYRDSVYIAEKNKTVLELETKYQIAQKEKIILQKEIETKQKNTWILIISSLVLISILTGYLLYRQQKIRYAHQKQEFELKNALAKIQAQNDLQEQRLSISRDLHDNIGSQLSFIISSVENMKFGLSNDNPKIESKLNQVSNFTKTTITELRDTIWAMNKNEITFQDLESRIQNFIANAKLAKENIEFTLNIEPSLNEISLSSIQWVNIYRTVQEAVNNAVKYAEADKIELNIKKQKDSVHIQIVDNGKGFEICKVELGNGIHNMKKRISEIGGDFDISSVINKGTTIQFTFNS